MEILEKGNLIYCIKSVTKKLKEETVYEYFSTVSSSFEKDGYINLIQNSSGFKKVKVDIQEFKKCKFHLLSNSKEVADILEMVNKEIYTFCKKSVTHKVLIKRIFKSYGITNVRFLYLTEINKIFDIFKALNPNIPRENELMIIMDNLRTRIIVNKI